MTNILIADDDPGLREILRYALDREGWRVTEAADGREALEAYRAADGLDLIVLDVMMPHMDGVDVCREIRRTSSIPIVFLSARDDEIDRVLGLEMGGDDYVAKPFSPRELVARIKAVLRRMERPAPPATANRDHPPILSHNRLTLDTVQFLAFFDGETVTLTVTEFGLLRALMERPGVVLKREQLMDGAYEVARHVSDRTIDSHIRRVRRKFATFGAEVIETVHGVGYKLGPC